MIFMAIAKITGAFIDTPPSITITTKTRLPPWLGLNAAPMIIIKDGTGLGIEVRPNPVPLPRGSRQLIEKQSRLINKKFCQSVVSAALGGPGNQGLVTVTTA